MAESQKLPDISQLTLAQLTDLAEQIAERRVDLEQRRRKELAAQFRELAEADGIELTDVLAELNLGAAPRNPIPRAAQSSTAGSKVAPKYRNPSDRSTTWTGRGRKPRWVEDYLAGGGTLDQLRI